MEIQGGITMITEERHHKIIDLLHKNKKIITNDLSEQFGVSLDTIRRDLTSLEKKGLLQKTYGGAVMPTQVRLLMTTDWKKHTSRRVGEGTPDYNSVSKAGAELICDGDTIFIGGGSTHYLMCRHLPKDMSFTVVTNSIAVADQLKNFDNIDTYVVSGRMNSGGLIQDTAAIKFIANIRMDKAYITGAGFTPEFGLGNARFETAHFQQAVIQSSSKVIALLPQRKFGKETFVKVVETKGIDVIITDSSVDKAMVTKVEDYGVEVIIGE